MQIKNLVLDSPFILAPLAGYTDLPFRLVCRKFGAGLCVSEMISCHGLFYNQPKTLAMLASADEERPVSFQLFGAEPEIMGKAASIMSSHHPDIIDINMGCPVKKVTKKGAGAALMATPDLARTIVREVVKNASCPVTVKFRTGVNAEELTAVDFGKMAEEAGAAAVTVHGRTWAQGFTGTANWEIIAQVKEALSIPVIGNGDIITHQQGLKLMADTGCDGVMIGRGALGNPWIFSNSPPPERIEEIIPAALLHLEYMEQYLPVNKMLGCLKSHIGKYFRNIKGCANMRKAVFECQDFSALKELVGKYSSTDQTDEK